MAKNKLVTEFVCSECGATSPRWLGRCPACGTFNTMVEEAVKTAPGSQSAAKTTTVKKAKPLSDITYEIYDRTSSGISEFDTAYTDCGASFADKKRIVRFRRRELFAGQNES